MRELPPGQVFAGYVIQRRLGAGGMGAVYLARHPRLPRLDALKLLDRALTADDDVRARFLREADHVAQLEHPNIVTVYDRGREDDQLWISMQYVDGDDASAAVRASGVLPVGRAVRMLSEVAKGLDYAHQHGVLHRDVKPANILLGRPTGGQDERVVLADFGIAKALEDTHGLTGTGMVLASFPYAAPEQFDPSITLDARADVYSLGCTFYQLITGTPPYAGTTAQQLMHGHLDAPIPRPSRVPAAREAGLSEAFDTVIKGALAKDRNDRLTSCRALAAAAQRALDSSAPTQATSAPESPSWPPAARPARTQHHPAVPVANPPSQTSIPRPHPVAAHRPDHTSTSTHAPGGRRRRLILVGALVAACAAIIVTVAFFVRPDPGPHPSVAPSPAPTGISGTATAASSDALPSGYVGAWQGIASDPLGLSFDILLALRDGRVGEEVGTLSQTAKFLSGQRCESQVLLKSVSSTKITFQERLSGGDSQCVDTGATTTLQIVPDGSLRFSMSEMGLGDITGTLHRQ